jgi:hypothetical protein
MVEWVTGKGGGPAKVGSGLWLWTETGVGKAMSGLVPGAGVALSSSTDALYISNWVFRSSKMAVVVLSLASYANGIRNKNYDIKNV